MNLKYLILFFSFVIFKTYAQDSNSNYEQCLKQISDEQTKESNDLLNKWYEADPHAGTYACADHCQLTYCRAHHKQCMSECDCAYKYFAEQKAFDSKLSAKREACEAALKEQQKLEKAKQDIALNKQKAEDEKLNQAMMKKLENNFDKEHSDKKPDPVTNASNITKTSSSNKINTKRMDAGSSKYGFCDYCVSVTQRDRCDGCYHTIFYITTVQDLTKLDYSSISQTNKDGTKKSLYDFYEECLKSWLKKRLNVVGINPPYYDDGYGSDPFSFFVKCSIPSRCCKNGNEDECFWMSKEEAEKARHNAIANIKEDVHSLGIKTNPTIIEIH